MHSSSADTFWYEQIWVYVCWKLLTECLPISVCALTLAVQLFWPWHGGKVLCCPLKYILCFSIGICCSDWQRLRACGYQPRACDSSCPLAPVWQTKYKGDRKEDVLLCWGPCNWKGRKQGGKGMHSDAIKPRFCLCLVKFPEQGAALGWTRSGFWHGPDSCPLHQLTVTALLLGDCFACAIKRPRSWRRQVIKPPRWGAWGSSAPQPGVSVLCGTRGSVRRGSGTGTQPLPGPGLRRRPATRNAQPPSPVIYSSVVLPAQNKPVGRGRLCGVGAEGGVWADGAAGLSPPPRRGAGHAEPPRAGAEAEAGQLPRRGARLECGRRPRAATFMESCSGGAAAAAKGRSAAATAPARSAGITPRRSGGAALPGKERRGSSDRTPRRAGVRRIPSEKGDGVSVGSATRAERHRAARGPGTPLEGGVEAEGCGRVGEPGGRSSGAARGRATALLSAERCGQKSARPWDAWLRASAPGAAGAVLSGCERRADRLLWSAVLFVSGFCRCKAARLGGNSALLWQLTNGLSPVLAWV